MAFGVGPGQGEQRPELLLSTYACRICTPASPASISEFHIRTKGIGAHTLVPGQQPVPHGLGMVGLATAPTLAFADHPLAPAPETDRSTTSVEGQAPTLLSRATLRKLSGGGIGDDDDGHRAQGETGLMRWVNFADDGVSLSQFLSHSLSSGWVR